jgi:hypothetical protein
MNRYRATYRKSRVEERPKPIVATYEAQNDLESIGLATKKLPTLNKRYYEDLTLETVERITYDTVYNRSTSIKSNVGIAGDNVGSQITKRLKSYPTDDVSKFFDEGDKDGEVL